MEGWWMGLQGRVLDNTVGPDGRGTDIWQNDSVANTFSLEMNECRSNPNHNAFAHQKDHSVTSLLHCEGGRGE